MRYESITILSGNSTASIDGAAKDVNQVVNLSVHARCSVNTVVGVIKLQASNDSPEGGQLRNAFTPTNWVDIPNATATISAGESELIKIENTAYSYLRAVWTVDAGGSTGTIVAQMVAVGV